jgi:CheY-like chemotaxis protein
MKNNAGETAKRIYVKVFGFSEAELEALNAAFRLSEPRSVAYSVWLADSPQKAQVALIDGDSWEASLALANPQNDALKLVWVGDRPPGNAWRFFPHPLHWDAVVTAMDRHYASGAARPGPQVAGLDLDLDLTGGADLALDSPADPVTAPMQLEAAAPVAGNRALVIDADRATRLYWRAKLSAIGRSLIDEASTAEAARQLVCFHVYELVVIDLNLADLSSWTLIKELSASRPPIEHIIVTGEGLSQLDIVRAWFAGAKSALPKPFHPGKLKDVLKKLPH